MDQDAHRRNALGIVSGLVVLGGLLGRDVLILVLRPWRQSAYGLTLSRHTLPSHALAASAIVVATGAAIAASPCGEPTDTRWTG